MKTPQFSDKLHRTHKTRTKSLPSPAAPATEQVQSNLNRRGRKTRTAVTAAEVDFCAYFVLTGNVKQASLQAGYSAWWGYELLKKPRIQPILRDFEKRKKDEAWATARDQIVLTRAFLDEQFIQRLVTMKTHPKVGDMALVKMFETGLQAHRRHSTSTHQRRGESLRLHSNFCQAPLPSRLAPKSDRETSE